MTRYNGLGDNSLITKSNVQIISMALIKTVTPILITPRHRYNPSNKYLLTLHVKK